MPNPYFNSINLFDKLLIREGQGDVQVGPMGGEPVGT